MDTKQKIKIMEDLSLNAWPSYQMQIYDGWILRFSYFYTHRTNCIEQLGHSSIPLQDKLDYCEDIYENGELRPFTRLTLFWTVLLTRG